MVTRRQRRSAAFWLWRSHHFVKAELASYPGRLHAALRLTLACTVSLVLVVLFKLPGAMLGAYFPFLIARDGLRSTQRSALLMSVTALIATVDIVVGAMLFAGSPLIHFLWVALNLLLVFFLISTCRLYEAVLGFGLILTLAITIWDRPTSTEARLSATLFTLLSVLIGCACTLAVEAIFQERTPMRYIRHNVHTRLSTAARYLDALAGKRHDLSSLRRSVRRLSHRGTVNDRKHLQGRAATPEVAMLVGLSGRLIDLLAAWSPSSESKLASSKSSLLELAVLLRATLNERKHALKIQRDEIVEEPLFHEIRETVYALVAVGEGRFFLDEDSIEMLEDRREPLFARDTFSNPRHYRFALRGALSALACYVAYMSVGWTGLSTALTTCILTAVPVLGSARHRQLLRFTGMFVGAGICGLLAECLLLSQMDSLLPFALVFAAFTVIAAWITSSTPRLAFAGLQIAYAFDVVVLNRFTVNPQLIAARDCILGILLGVVAMWLVFDQFWPSDSKDALPSVLLRTLKSHATPIGKTPEVCCAHSLTAIRRSEDLFRSIDKLEFLFDLRRFEDGLDAQPDLRLVMMKKALKPLRRMTALVPVQYPGRDSSLSDSVRPRKMFERTVLACVALIEGRQPGSEDGTDALTELEAELRIVSGDHGPHAENERRATLSYIRSLRRLRQLSERYYRVHYAGN